MCDRPSMTGVFRWRPALPQGLKISLLGHFSSSGAWLRFLRWVGSPAMPRAGSAGSVVRSNVDVADVLQSE
jgi:hypothetical protein